MAAGRHVPLAPPAPRDPICETSFIAVEAEPTHFQWLREHFEINNIDLARCKLVNAPVTGKEETVHFTVGHADEWYGQAVIPKGSSFGNWPEATVVTMTSTTIPALIADLRYVDLIDMDIQGAELPCVEILDRTAQREGPEAFHLHPQRRDSRAHLHDLEQRRLV